MSTLQRIEYSLAGLVRVLFGIFMIYKPFESYVPIARILVAVLVLMGLRNLLYYVLMARHMVGGKMILFIGMLFMDFPGREAKAVPHQLPDRLPLLLGKPQYHKSGRGKKKFHADLEERLHAGNSPYADHGGSHPICLFCPQARYFILRRNYLLRNCPHRIGLTQYRNRVYPVRLDTINSTLNISFHFAASGIYSYRS